MGGGAWVVAAAVPAAFSPSLTRHAFVGRAAGVYRCHHLFWKDGACYRRKGGRVEWR